MPTNRRFIGPLAAAVLPASLLAGCSGVPQSEYDEVFDENIEIRERLGRYEAALEQSETDKATLVERNRELVGRIEELSARAATGPEASTPDQTVRGENVVITVAGDVLFASGSADIKPAGRRKLDEIAGRVQRSFPGTLIRVEGYTDTDQIRRSRWKDNEELSAARALAVERYLVSRGLPANRVYSAAMGPANPKPTKAASRRVEIVVLGAAD